VWSQAY
jgi:hypothetical protein